MINATNEKRIESAIASVIDAVESLTLVLGGRGIKGYEEIPIREMIGPLAKWVEKYKHLIKEAKSNEQI